MSSQIDWQSLGSPHAHLFRDGHLEGLVVDELNDEVFRKQLGNIETLLRDHTTHVYLHARNLIAAVRLDYPSGMPKTVVIKRFNKGNPVQKFLYSFLLSSKALQSWTVACYLIQNGLGTPRPMAIFENRQSGWLSHCYYISDQIQNYKTLRELNKELTHDFGKKLAVIGALARYMRALHDAGVYHKDLTPRNFLFEEDTRHGYHIYLVDLNRARIKKKVSVYRRIRDLARIKVCACPTDGQSLRKITCGYDPRCERTIFLELYFKVPEHYRPYRFFCWLMHVLSLGGFRFRRGLRNIRC
jgi:tRNA A-37 threonylcarbamoyl transferase component Bud32